MVIKRRANRGLENSHHLCWLNSAIQILKASYFSLFVEVNHNKSAFYNLLKFIKTLRFMYYKH